MGELSMKPDYRRLKYACYSTNLSMSVIGSLQPLLFVSFRELWQSLCFVPASGLFFQLNLKDFLFLSFHPLFD